MIWWIITIGLGIWAVLATVAATEAETYSRWAHDRLDAMTKDYTSASDQRDKARAMVRRLIDQAQVNLEVVRELATERGDES